jgi:hypothetical protein
MGSGRKVGRGKSRRTNVRRLGQDESKGGDEAPRSELDGGEDESLRDVGEDEEQGDPVTPHVSEG